MKSAFVSKLLSSPWNIDKLRGRTIIANVALKLLRNERPSEDVFGDPLPTMQIQGDVAIIPIRGAVSMAVPDWIKSYGLDLTDANDIEEEVQRAVADPNVRFIVYDCDSPGGLSLAGDKLFDVTEQAARRKPIFAWCGDGCDMASTTYEAVASCPAILAGYYALGVGCIGSYLAYLDDTDFWTQMGIKIELFRSGELKGIGETALTETQRAYLQSSVDDAGAIFRRNVSKYRTTIAVDDMQGQWFDGKRAATRGFVSGNADNLQQAIVKFRNFL